jgi:colanic acid/amylovoran biosynthesis protein
MKIVMLNGHSALNAGDAAIVLAQAQRFRILAPAAELVLVSRTPACDREFYRRAGIRVVAAPFRRPFARSTRAGKALALLRDLFAWGDLASLAAELRRADLAVSCGGGYLYSYARAFPGPAFWQVVFQVRLALGLGRPVILLPQSYGPFRSPVSRLVVRRLLRHPRLRRALAREEISLAWLRSLAGGGEGAGKVALCPDLALGYDAEGGHAAPFAADLPRPRFAVTLIDWPFPGDTRGRGRERKRERYLEEMAKACRALFARFGGSLLLLPHALGPSPAEDDRRISRRLLERLGGTVPPDRLRLWPRADDLSPAAVVSLLKGCDLLIAGRLHSAILGMLAGTPVIAVGYQHKSEGVMRLLGLEDSFVAIDDLRAEWVVAKAGELAARGAAGREALGGALHRQREAIAREAALWLAGDPAEGA